jgi:large subunit ribosomal protein L19
MNQQAVLHEIEKQYMKPEIPELRAGDTVRVHVRVREAGKERTQMFEGVIIARKHGGVRDTITVRKISYGVGVERTFPIHAPVVSQLEVVRRGKVRRAKLYYLRERFGKAARLKEDMSRPRNTMVKTAAAVVAEAVEEPVVAVVAEVAAPVEEVTTPVIAEEATTPVMEMETPVETADPVEAVEETAPVAAEVENIEETVAEMAETAEETAVETEATELDAATEEVAASSTDEDTPATNETAEEEKS